MPVESRKQIKMAGQADYGELIESDLVLVLVLEVDDGSTPVHPINCLKAHRQVAHSQIHEVAVVVQ